MLYAYNKSYAQQPTAQEWLEKMFAGTEPVGLAWITLLAFLRIATNARAFPHPLSATEAVETVGQWLALPTVEIIEPGERHWELLSRFMTKTQALGPLVMDAQLAALAVEHGAILYTTDQDFRRFPELKFINPLET